MSIWQKRPFKISLASIIVLGIGWLFYGPISNLITRSVDSKAIEILKEYGLAEDVYFKEFNEYSGDPNQAGFSLAVQEMEVFFTKESLPTKYLVVLSPSSLPYVAKNSYRILLAVQNKRQRHIDFWTMDKRKQPVKISETAPLN